MVSVKLTVLLFNNSQIQVLSWLITMRSTVYEYIVLNCLTRETNLGNGLRCYLIYQTRAISGKKIIFNFLNILCP